MLKMTSVINIPSNNLFIQGIATDAKLNDITSAVVQNINQRCQCGLSAERITEGAFQCFEHSERQVTFRARLHGTVKMESLQLLAYLETFAAQADSTIAVQGLRLNVGRSCPIAINSFGDPQCTTSTSADNTAATVGGVVAVIVVIAITIIIITIAAFVTRSHRATFSAYQDTR